MSITLTRRAATLAALSLAFRAGLRGKAGLAAAQFAGVRMRDPQPFNFDLLTAEAKKRAAVPYVPEPPRAQALLERIDFEQHIEISYRPDRTLFQGQPFPIRLFHPGKFFQEPVHVAVVENGQAREIVYSPDLFTFGPKAAFARNLPDDLGFAGFRVMNPDLHGDWLAYLGASYFRSAGELQQYGLSARGLAVDTALPTPEEFPRFTHFYLEPGRDAITVFALLQSASLTGAYRFIWHDGKGVWGDVEARLFQRRSVARLGIAPLTSMYWFSETNRANAPDWRPEIHDSDGLAIATGTGERLWRPLNNPPRVMTSTFFDRSPKGFGLLQRDRQFDSYEDDGVFYNRRPSVWIEPLGDWGQGAVQLVEIPTDVEIHDNIVVYWVPAEPARAGSALTFSYRIYWTAEEPHPPSAAQVVATRRGRGGRPGEKAKIGFTKYAIDFAGGGIEKFESADGLIPVIEASRGIVADPYALRVNGTPKWRLVFDLKATGVQPVELRAYLKDPRGRALTETWLFQHFPSEAA
jgi:periplasmic glucans biosynthesis protein